MRRRPYRHRCIQHVACRRRRGLAVGSGRDLHLYAWLLSAMGGGWSEPIAPALMAAGLLCVLLPWANRENSFVRAILVTTSLIMTWNYLLWRITTLPQYGTADWLFGAAFLDTELLTGIGGTITWILLTRGSSRSAAVDANMPWLLQARPLVDVLICTYNEDQAILER